MGKIFIFRFKLNERNLTEGRQGYLVTRTYIADDMLEEKFINDQNKKVRIIIFHVHILIHFLIM
jgi:hypothetical protein